MINIRRSDERGHANHGWLDTYHTFSFASYYDPNYMGFRSLRVINEDRVAPGKGFGTHPHDNMEIVTYVLEGALQHKDSMGTGSVIRHGNVQRMSAGTGILHSEFNPSDKEEVHLLQIWLLPQERGIKPSYEEKSFNLDSITGGFRLIVSPDGRDDSLSINQDVLLYASILAEGESAELNLREGRHAWIQVARGSVALNGQALKQGDGASVSVETTLTVEAVEPAELLLFDLA